VFFFGNRHEISQMPKFHVDTLQASVQIKGDNTFLNGSPPKLQNFTRFVEIEPRSPGAKFAGISITEITDKI
jgi:hypothetical protein